VFADIAGFTALTEAHGDEQAAALVAEFCAAVNAELQTFGATHVKSIGDALMLRVPEPGDAVRLGLHIVHDLMPGHGAPAVRAGLHHGPYVERDGDFFGAPGTPRSGWPSTPSAGWPSTATTRPAG
jgi:adenylate cyclase